MCMQNPGLSKETTIGPDKRSASRCVACAPFLFDIFRCHPTTPPFRQWRKMPNPAVPLPGPSTSEIKRLPQISEEQGVCPMAEGNNYYIRVRGTLVQVTSEVYSACHQAKRRVKTLYEKDERNGLVSYDSMDTEDTLGEEMIPDHSLPCVEDAALENLLREKLRYCLKQLPQTDQGLLHALYFTAII